MERGGCIYIMTNKNKTVLYVGVTSDLLSRITVHKTHTYPNSFTSKFNLEFCIYFEFHPTIEDAIAREKQVKKYRREKKIALIENINPLWKDLFDEVKTW